MAKEELCEKVVEERRVSDREMTLVVVFLRRCADDDVWAFSTKWKKFGRKTVFL